ncbi:MAG: tyrosine-protein phosphatase [Bacteroidales bacterium]
MKKILQHITILIITLFFAGCATAKTDVLTVCELNSVNNYELRWEVYPPVQGSLQVYRFETGDLSYKDIRYPDQVIAIDKGRLEVSDNNGKRAFFYLNFNNEYHEVISNRFIKIPGVDVIRDLGGYRTRSGAQVAWGKLLRGPEFKGLHPVSYNQLKQLDMNLMISLDADRYDKLAEKKIFRNYRHIPVFLKGYNQIQERIYANECKRGDVALFIEDLYSYLLKSKKEEFSTIFRLLSEKENYPVLLSSHHPEEKNDFISVLLLEFLGVSEEDILDDYMTSNDGLDLRKYLSVVDDLCVDSQESLTYLLTANKRSAHYLLEKVRREYGSVEAYFKKELRLKDKEINNIRQNLLLTL